MLNKLFLLILVLGLGACASPNPNRSTADRGVVRVKPAPLIPAIIPISTKTKKIALVIGNKKYDFSPLRNTVNDAIDMAAVLRKIGFEVILKTDLDLRGMKEALHNFGQRLAKTQGIGLFYYSGHGARAGGENYLLPINNNQIKKAADLEYDALPSSRVLKTMKDAKTELNIIVLDACRDNPFKSVGRTLNRGLSRMQGIGSIIAFATAEKDTASDISNNQRNGLFTSHLLAALKNAPKTHQRIDDMFMQVSQAVFGESGGEQQPWYNASLRTPFCFGGCLTVASNTTVSQVPVVTPVVPRVTSKFFRDTLRDGSKGPEMVRIPAGSFRMGDIQGGGRDNEKPVHRVSVAAFSMGKFEVTFAEYDKFAQATGKNKPDDSGWGRGNRPVINVSWNDAVAYAQWLSTETGKNYRLPTEAEWEYSARAGTETKYWWGNDIGSNKANCWESYCGDNYEYTAPVGSFAANQFGLHDTAGNVWEWTCSEYEKKYQGKEQSCKKSASYFALRGGSWYDGAAGSRTAIRFWYDPTERGGNNGVRLIRTP